MQEVRSTGRLDTGQCRRDLQCIVTVGRQCCFFTLGKGPPRSEMRHLVACHCLSCQLIFERGESRFPFFSLGSRQFRLLRRETFAYFRGNDNHVYKKLDVSEQKLKNVVSFSFARCKICGGGINIRRNTEARTKIGFWEIHGVFCFLIVLQLYPGSQPGLALPRPLWVSLRSLASFPKPVPLHNEPGSSSPPLGSSDIS